MGSIPKTSPLETISLLISTHIMTCLFISGHRQLGLIVLMSFELMPFLAHETQALIKGREDYEKLLGYTIEQVSGKSCACTNGIDNPNTPAIVYLAYIMSIQSLLSAFQKSQVLAILESYRPYGVQPPQLFDPVVMDWITSVTIYYSSNIGSTYTPYSVQADVTAIFNQYTMQLGIMMGDQLARLIERQIDNLSYVEVSRVSFDASTPTELLWNEYAVMQQLTITTGT